MAYKFETTLYLDNVPFVIRANFFPGEPMTYWEPGAPDDVELESIWFCGIKFTDEQENLFVDSFGEDDLNQWLLEESYNNIRDYEAEREDYLYEKMKDERNGFI